MSIYQKASLVQIPSGYKSGTLYNVLPNTADGDFDFTRGSSATRVNKDGLIETVASGVPRLDYPLLDGVVQDCPTLLLEPQRTNSLTYSEDFSQGIWFKLNSTVTQSASTSPDGSQNAYNLHFNGTVNASLRHSITTTNTKIYTFSIWIKKISANYTNNNKARIEGFGSGAVGFLLLGDALNSAAVGEFVRYSVTTTASTGGTSYFQFRSDEEATFEVWGAQLEQGSYPSSYIPTSGSAVTRTADSNEVASGLENIIGQTEGTVFLDFEYLYETTSDSSTDALRDIFVVGTAADISEGISIDNYRSQFRVFVQGSGMTTQSIGNNTAGASQPNTRYKLAVKYKTGDCKAYLNGSLLGSSTGTVSFATDLDGIFFSYNSSSRPYKNQKKVYQLMIFNEALSGSELETITSYKSFGQMAKALLYTIE